MNQCFACSNKKLIIFFLILIGLSLLTLKKEKFINIEDEIEMKEKERQFLSSISQNMDKSINRMTLPKFDYYKTSTDLGDYYDIVL